MKYSSTLARLKVIKIDKNLQNLTKISYLANSFALETFRDKYPINEIEERSIHVKNITRSYFIPVFNDAYLGTYTSPRMRIIRKISTIRIHYFIVCSAKDILYISKNEISKL